MFQEGKALPMLQHLRSLGHHLDLDEVEMDVLHSREVLFVLSST